MNISAKYKITRMFFGLVLIIISLKNFKDMENLKSIVTKNIESYISVFERTDLSQARNTLGLNIDDTFNLKALGRSSTEIVFFVNTFLFLGGFLCMVGYSMSRFLIVLSIVLDLLLIHNPRYFFEETKKGIVIKLIAFLGGAFYII